MHQRIINGVLLTQEEGSLHYQAITRMGTLINFRRRLSGWVVVIGDPRGDIEADYFHLADAVQWVRSKGYRFPPLAANAKAWRSKRGEREGWEIRLDDDSRTDVFVPSRGRHATTTDLYRRTDTYVMESAKTDGIPILFVG